MPISPTNYYGLWVNLKKWARVWADERYALIGSGAPTTNAFDVDVYGDLMPSISVVVEDPDWELDGDNNLMPKAA